MLENITFGKFLTTKRKQAKYTIRSLAAALSLSETYLCNVEKGRRPAPSKNYLRKMVEILELNTLDKYLFYDLATKTKQRVTVPQDVLEYISDDDVCSFLRKAISCNYTGKDLLELLNG